MSNFKHIIATNVILALLIRFSTQFIHNKSDTYQAMSDWSIETNLLDFDDENSNEQLMAFSEFSFSNVSRWNGGAMK